MRAESGRTARMEGDAFANDALQRVASAQEVALALNDLAQLARQIGPSAAQHLNRAFILLAECQAALMTGECSTIAAERDDDDESRPVNGNVERFLYFWRLLQETEAGERARIICNRTGWSASKYYRVRTDAIERGLISRP